MDRAGNGVQQLTDGPGDDRQPAWSPDGGELAFVSTRDGAGDLYVRAADGTVRRLTADDIPTGYPSWGPGGLIAFSEMSAGTWQLFVVRPDGSGRRSLGAGASATWSPDGTRLAYVAAGRVRVVTATGRRTGLGWKGSPTDLAWGRLPRATRPRDGTFAVRRDSGTVRIRPGSSDVATPFPITLRDPVATTSTLAVDARQGAVTIRIRVRGSAKHVTTIRAARGRFTISQASPGAAPVIRVRGTPPAPCGRHPAHASRPIDHYFKAHVNGKGKYLGFHGSASAVGTIWAASETCRGTQFVVKQGELRTKSANSRSTGVARSRSRSLWGSGHGKFRTKGKFSAATIVG
jgi:hypothetical protein